ncbi:hypothetical protein EYR40_009140 [Pleurotus pulmonarius]|nr:hypothetical protein EYR40_009140 [Pleurotus pulmonarius]
MITLKVWKANRTTTPFLDADHLCYSNPRPMALTLSVLYTLLESAGLYTLCVIVTAIAPLLSSNWLSAFLSAIGPMIGIAFSLIILLIALGRTVERSDMTEPTFLVFRQSDVDVNGVDKVNGEGCSYRRTEYESEGEREVHDAGMGAGNGIQHNAVSPSSIVDV